MTDAEVAVLEAKLDALHDDVLEVKKLAEATNGRLRAVEIWKARMDGAKAALHWVPALVSGLLCTGLTAAVTILLTTH